jgi:hypothetical protein
MGIVQHYVGGLPKIAKCYREDAHERAIPVAVFISQPSLLGFESLAQAVDGPVGGPADVEYLIPGSPVSLLKPAYEQTAEVLSIKPVQQALNCT